MQKSLRTAREELARSKDVLASRDAELAGLQKSSAEVARKVQLQLDGKTEEVAQLAATVGELESVKREFETGKHRSCPHLVSLVVLVCRLWRFAAHHDMHSASMTRWR